MSQITKRALAASLKNMLLKKPLNKITINDIAEDCGINRMTFYYHFKDIYDLVEWTCEEDAAKALEGKKTYNTWQQGFLNIFYAVLENKPFIMNVYRSVSREQVEIYLYRVTYDLLIGVVNERSANMSVSEDDKKFFADQIMVDKTLAVMTDTAVEVEKAEKKTAKKASARKTKKAEEKPEEKDAE